MGSQVILHTFWGGRVNQPYGLALDAAWEERFDSRLEVYPTNDCIIIVLPDDTPPMRSCRSYTRGGSRRFCVHAWKRPASLAPAFESARSGLCC